MVTIYDIAKRSNCSHMTVSRVINNTGNVSEQTRRRVKAVMEELGYVPNTMARSLVKQETRVLSLLIPDITNPFYTSLARGAEDAARKGGYRLLLANSDEELDKEAEYIETVLAARVDGVLIAPAGDPSAAHLNKLTRHKVPYVLLDREVQGIEADVLLGDSKEGAQRLVSHLLQLGHTRIALINGSKIISTARLREEGYVEALRLAGLTPEPELMFETGYKRFDAGAIVARVTSGLHGKPVSAIFAANNFIALALMQALRKKGLHVPGDLSLVCFDDVSAEYMYEPFLTSVLQPAYEFGQVGMQLLIQRIAAPERPLQRVLLPSRLEIRRSTAAAAAPH